VSDLKNAAASDDRLRALKALRDRLAVEIDDCESKRDMAALSLRFMDVVEQIDCLGGGAEPAKKETRLSDFERRLREREAKAARRSKAG
jgi:phage shock protein A